MFAEDRPSRLGAMHITLRSLRFVNVGIIYPILGRVVFQISFTHYGNILAHNTALVTRGNSGWPRLNSSRKSSDIPLPTQSPIWVNPMGPITQSFDKKCHNVTTPGNNFQISSTYVLSLNTCSYRAGSGHCIRDIPLIWLINMINTQCRLAFMSTKLILSRVHVPPATQWSAWRCALFDVNKPAPVAAVQYKSDNTRMTTGSRKPGVFIKTAHHE